MSVLALDTPLSLRNTITLNRQNGLELNNNGNFISNNIIHKKRLSNIDITGKSNVLERN
jgi:hypothetical protein